jgi:hypothetical protein
VPTSPAYDPRPPDRPLVVETRRPATPEGELGEQSVHVTIGRIEVRAPAPQAPPAPVPQPERTPTLSLDEYLRTRGGIAS